MKQIVLETGRKIVLERYYKQVADLGVMEGLPSSEQNEWIREQFLKIVGGIFEWPVHLLQSGARATPGGPALGAFACAGQFMSWQPVPGSRGMASALVVAWFQDEADLVMTEKIERQIIQVPWDRDARSFDW